VDWVLLLVFALLWQKLKVISGLLFTIQKTETGDKRVPELGAEPNSDERTLSTEDKGPSYTNIVSTLLKRSEWFFFCWSCKRKVLN